MKAFKVVADIAILAGKAAAKAGLIIPQIVGKRSADPELDSLDLSLGPVTLAAEDGDVVVVDEAV